MKKLIKHLFHWKWQLVSLIFALGFVALLFQYVRIKNQRNGLDSREVLNKLSQFMVLPNDKPQIQPLTDIQLTKENYPDLYNDAQPDDLVIQYPNAIFLYDPVKNKIINLAASGVLNKAKPAQTLTIAFRYAGNELYRALFLKRQVEEDMGNSSYQVIEISQSKIPYKNDVIYIVNPSKQDMITQFAKAIGNSPVVATPVPNEAPTTADIIVAFKAMQ